MRVLNSILINLKIFQGIPKSDKMELIIQKSTELGVKEIEKAYKRSKTVVKEKTVGRNEPCPCGSGKKYKKCCGK